MAGLSLSRVALRNGQVVPCSPWTSTCPGMTKNLHCKCVLKNSCVQKGKRLYGGLRKEHLLPWVCAVHCSPAPAAGPGAPFVWNSPVPMSSRAGLSPSSPGSRPLLVTAGCPPARAASLSEGRAGHCEPYKAGSSLGTLSPSQAGVHSLLLFCREIHLWLLSSCIWYPPGSVRALKWCWQLESASWIMRLNVSLSVFLLFYFLCFLSTLRTVHSDCISFFLFFKSSVK